jgi:hypothetical protein
MIKTPDQLQDLRRKIYAKAKAEPQWRFWGLYVHVCKWETLQAAYAMAKSNDGAPGIDGVTFEAIEEQGVEGFLPARQTPTLPTFWLGTSRAIPWGLLIDVSGFLEPQFDPAEELTRWFALAGRQARPRLNVSVARTSSRAVPASNAEWPASPTMRSRASGQARAGPRRCAWGRSRRSGPG